MKKLSLFLCLFLLVSLIPTASADEFVLRSGIEFGDTMDIILQKETALTRESETSNAFKGKIAGFSDASCIFYFDDNDRLESMDYAFGSDVCTSKEKMNDVYEELYGSLCRKYGKPLGNTGGSCYLITGPAIDRMAAFVYFLGTMDGYSADYVDYDEWLVDDGNDHVKIDLISYYFRDKKYSYDYYVDVSYHHYTDADVEAEQAEKQEKRAEVDNDM